MKSLFELNGGTYSTIGDYLIPDLTFPEEPDFYLGSWGNQRLAYLKDRERVLYVNLLTSGDLAGHLREIDTAAQEMWDNVIEQMAKAQGVTEQLKAECQMEWVGRMNNIRACASEVVLSELIYR